MASPTDPPAGETPLTTAPTWGGSGGGTQAQQVYAWTDFVNMFGRNPTQAELDMLAPSYNSGDPNKANVSGGNAAVAAYYTQLNNTPQAIYQQQQAQYAAQAGNYSDQVSSAFETTLGRAPTTAEQQYYGSLMASGQDQYQVQQALQQTQEYQNVQNTNFQNQLQNQLQQSNSTYFNQYIAPSLQAQNAMSGQAPGSSALSSQLANAALQQNQGLQNFLAGVTAQNYQNSTANAASQYNSLMNQQYGLQNAGVSNALANQSANTQYNQNLNMYQMQLQAYNNYLNQYGKSGVLGDISTGFQGLGAVGSLLGGLSKVGALGSTAASATI